MEGIEGLSDWSLVRFHWFPVKISSLGFQLSPPIVSVCPREWLRIFYLNTTGIPWGQCVQSGWRKATYESLRLEENVSASTWLWKLKLLWMNLKLWRAKPKSHLTSHILDLVALGHNPQDSWNYRDETRAGCVQKLSEGVANLTQEWLGCCKMQGILEGQDRDFSTQPSSIPGSKNFETLTISSSCTAW